MTILDKVIATAQATVLDRAITTAQSVIPMSLQFRSVHLYEKLRRMAFADARPPTFAERPLPDVADLPLEQIDLSSPFLFRQGRWQSYFKRLREEAPVHYQPNSAFGPFWSVTRYEDILHVDKSHDLFSAEPFIVLGEPPKGMNLEMFIAMDPPRHDHQRQAVQGVVAPKNLKEMEGLIRQRVQDVLDNLPVGKAFNWVDHVSIELTSRMLATLLDFPYEQRRKLVYWSDLLAGSAETTGGPLDLDELMNGAIDMARHFKALWHDKAARSAAGEAPGFDLITQMQCHESTRDLIKRPMEFIGNLALLIVGGNDTTRNSMSAGVLAMNRFPDQFEKLKADPGLIPNMVSEIIRWQTPLAYMRRVAKKDTMLNGQFIRKGDKVVMWYASGNRDESVFERPDDFIIDRANARNHMSFGFGVHRCMGNRLAELQLRILWEELLTRFERIETLGEPTMVQSNFIRGYDTLMVRLAERK
ncbi:cytochrome P450 [Zavarzinia compransoris]|uniref:Cytochrome P450 n=1 Tax=Zavarzinia compransoris TaxID=1264899 RepID=A0A317E4S0_9PROT|nr:cytochrome P450 [Zavarzinia compransoris]PWR21572.1 cytochrome P450 [Zavarzinia compransoris]TDP45653.1 cytochrome P450 [Zavarzinia compransoris]